MNNIRASATEIVNAEYIEENEVFPAIFPHDILTLGSSLTPRFQVDKLTRQRLIRK